MRFICRRALIRLSRDPIQGIKPFTDLLNMVSADAEKADSEVALRVANTGSSSEEESTDQYRTEKERIALCRTIIEEVKKNHVNG